jgi:acyl-CoA hydrolase
MWGQANAEPVPLTQALMAQRHSIGDFSVFLGITYSDTLKAEYADCIRFSAYCGTGGNRVLAKAGKLDILPCHYSHLRELIASGRLKVDVLLLQLAPANERGEYGLSIAHEYLSALAAAASSSRSERTRTLDLRRGRARGRSRLHRAHRAPRSARHPQPGRPSRRSRARSPH